ncbi:MAG: DNA primase [Paracoccaceae bacterium]
MRIHSRGMALPPGFLDEIRTRLTLSDVAGRKVIWDARKSNPAKGDFWAPCPFHQEKTPSFHVDDRKGFYYCFGCHEKGDMIGFVKDTENVSFIEAVEVLAREAGLEMPAQTQDPQAAEKRDQQTRQIDVMEQSVRAFGMSLRGAAAASVREYCQRRGLTGETAKRFEIGFAPDSRTFLTETFREKGQLDEAIAAGMVIKSDDGSTYDRFRNRLMFPIRDPRGRCIGFGGRAMSENARAKYMNSPATDLFDKSRVLYNYGPAREAAGKTQTLIVAEGYMDVIALAQAGFDHSVAPNGTAVTEQQLAMMWKIADEPIIALDGDKAGIRAAERLIDLALPLLAPGKSLRFCLMPEGRDPDDLIKAEGPGAMQTALDAALPLIEMLWRRETTQPYDTPERKAALDQRLRALLGRIQDPGLRNHYGAEIKARRADLFTPPARQTGGNARSPWQGGNWQGGRGGRARTPSGPAPSTRASQLSRTATQVTEARVREAGILTGILLHPHVLPEVEDPLETMRFLSQDMAQMRDLMLDTDVLPANLIDHLANKLGRDPIGALSSVAHQRMHALARKGLKPQHVAEVTRDAIARHEAVLTSEAELAEARRDLAEAADESWCERVKQVAQERMAADTHATRDDPSNEAENPLGVRGDVQKLLDQRAWEKSVRRD